MTNSNMQQVDQTVVDLLELESSKAVGMDPGITTVTIFSCDNVIPVVSHLKHRVLQTLQANPWLAGKLVKKKDEPRLQLHYPNIVSEHNVNKLFFENVALEIDLDKPFPVICKAIAKNKTVMVPAGSSLINTVKPLLRLSISPVKDNHYAIIYSLSHTIADGSTFYQIQNMLFGGTDIYPLNVRRNQQYSMKAAVGKQDNGFVFSKSFMFNMIKGIVFGRKPKYFAFYINEAGIQETKDQFKKSNPDSYISTNDIISSSFMRAIKARLGMLVINFRNRFPGVTTKDAGNYEGVKFYDSAVFDTPGAIRQSLQGDLPFKTSKNKLPGTLESLHMRMAQVNNWASFSGGFNLSGCELKIHLPVIPSTIPCDIAVLFRPKLDRTAILILSKTHDKDFYQGNSSNPLGEYLGEEVSKTIFD